MRPAQGDKQTCSVHYFGWWSPNQQRFLWDHQFFRFPLRQMENYLTGTHLYPASTPLVQTVLAQEKHQGGVFTRHPLPIPLQLKWHADQVHKCFGPFPAEDPGQGVRKTNHQGDFSSHWLVRQLVAVPIGTDNTTWKLSTLRYFCPWFVVFTMKHPTKWDQSHKVTKAHPGTSYWHIEFYVLCLFGDQKPPSTHSGNPFVGQNLTNILWKSSKVFYAKTNFLFFASSWLILFQFHVWGFLSTNGLRSYKTEPGATSSGQWGAVKTATSDSGTPMTGPHFTLVLVRSASGWRPSSLEREKHRDWERGRNLSFAFVVAAPIGLFEMLTRKLFLPF